MTSKAAVAVLEIAQHGLAAVAPLSRIFALHRLLSLLIPTRWVRAAMEAVVIPLVAPSAVGWPTTPSPLRGAEANATAAGTVPEIRSQNSGRPVNPADRSDTFYTSSDTSGVLPSVNPDLTEAVEADPLYGGDAEPRNRAERRARQQAQARTRKADPRRPAGS